MRKVSALPMIINGPEDKRKSGLPGSSFAHFSLGSAYFLAVQKRCISSFAHFSLRSAYFLAVQKRCISSFAHFSLGSAYFLAIQQGYPCRFWSARLLCHLRGSQTVDVCSDPRGVFKIRCDKIHVILVKILIPAVAVAVNFQHMHCTIRRYIFSQFFVIFYPQFYPSLLLTPC
jgi:hypothetical protein